MLTESSCAFLLKRRGGALTAGLQDVRKCHMRPVLAGDSIPGFHQWIVGVDLVVRGR
jgi:hypothetical protein